MENEIPKNTPKVLVVDDDRNIFEVLRNFLRREGCDVVWASTPEVALGRIHENDIDLLISDIRPEHQSGRGLLAQLKSIKSDLPVILITGYPEAISEKDVKALGADHFFQKPLDLLQMRRAVRSCLHLSM